MTILKVPSSTIGPLMKGHSQFLEPPLGKKICVAQYKELNIE